MGVRPGDAQRCFYQLPHNDHGDAIAPLTPAGQPYQYRWVDHDNGGDLVYAETADDLSQRMDPRLPGRRTLRQGTEQFGQAKLDAGFFASHWGRATPAERDSARWPVDAGKPSPSSRQDEATTRLPRWGTAARTTTPAARAGR